jgi:hypothetical protein
LGLPEISKNLHISGPFWLISAPLNSGDEAVSMAFNFIYELDLFSAFDGRSLSLACHLTVILGTSY